MPRERPYFGPAVTEDRELRYTSVSSLQSFDEEGTDGGCNRKWAGVKVFDWEDPGSKAQDRGIILHGEVEHYYLTGEDVRGSVMRAGAHLLPRRGPDLFIEQAFGAAVEKSNIDKRLLVESDPVVLDSMRKRLVWVEEQLRLPGGTVPLLAGGLPLVGFIDMRHQRGEYIDEQGVLKQEDPSLGLVVEPIDHKTTSSIKNWAKTGHDVAKTIQMVGYGVRVSDIVPETKYIRPSHVYYQTRGAFTAKKSTHLVSIDEVRRRWRRVDGLVDEMRLVAKKGSIEDVRPNYNACSTFGGCPHQSYCPRSGRTIYHVLGITPGENMESLGLFDFVSTPAVSPAPPSSQGLGLFGEQPSAPSMSPPIPIISEEERLARIAIATTRLQAEDAGVPALPSLPAPVRPCGAPGCGVDCAPGCVGSVPCPACLGKGAAGLTAVLPPDAAPSTPLEDASPLSAEEIAKITDPTLRQRVEEHARLAAEAKEKEDAEKAAAGGQKTSGNCPGGKQKVMIASPKARGNKVTCTACGRVLPVKPAADGSAIVPGHRLQEEKTQTGQTATGIPALPSGIPTLPVNIPPSPGGVPPLPTDIPPLPGGVPSSPILFTVEQVSAALDRVLAPLLQQVQEMQRQITALSK